MCKYVVIRESVTGPKEDGQVETGPEETCRVCAEPPTLGNATVLPGYNEQGAVRSYVCNNGFVLKSGSVIGGDVNSDVICLQSGQWSEPTFECEYDEPLGHIFGLLVYLGFH